MEDIKQVNDKSILPAKSYVDSILNKYFPIGTVYFTSTDRNPEEFLVGKWKRIAQGRVVVGEGAGIDINGEEQTFVINSTGGENKHKLTTEELPKHTHNYPTYVSFDNVANDGIWTVHDHGSSSTTSSVGNDKPHNNMQPYVVKYIWERYE